MSNEDPIQVVSKGVLQKAISQYLANEGFGKAELRTMIGERLDGAIEKAVTHVLEASNIERVILDQVAHCVSEGVKDTRWNKVKFETLVKNAVHDAINKSFTISVTAQSRENSR